MDFLRRGRVASGGDAEQQTVVMDETENLSPQNDMQQQSLWRLGPLSVRRPVPFARRSVNDTPNTTANSTDDITDEADSRHIDRAEGARESPKTPPFNLGFRLPPLQLENADEAIPNQSGLRHGAHPTTDHGSEAEAQQFPPPRPTTVASPVHLPESRRHDAPDPARSQIESMGPAPHEQSERQQQPGRLGRRTRARFGEASEPSTQPKRFIYCLPWTASRRIRSLALQCFVSGSLVVLTLTVYLALTLSGKIQQSEFTVLLILMILFAAVFFSHRVIRLCLLVYRPQSEEQVSSEVQRLGIFAVPDQPIRVVLARDEEEVAEAEAGPQAAKKPKPPPYGAWRQSVRVDPNRIYWQRNPEVALNEPAPSRGPEGLMRPGNTLGSRPPSYASEDGVDYVVEARPRSMAPTTMLEMPLPLPLLVHPSEAGRQNGRQAPW